MKKKRKLSLKRDERRALLKSLAVNLILREKIKTTQAKAKELRPLIERLITKTKRQDLKGIRQAAKFLPQIAVKKLTKEITPRYLERSGGYTRIIKLGQRKSDGAKMAMIEFV